MRKTKQTRSRHTRRHTKIVILPQDVRVNDALEGPLILRHAAHAIENASKVLERWSCQNSWPARELKNEHHLCPQLCTWSGAYTYTLFIVTPSNVSAPYALFSAMTSVSEYNFAYDLMHRNCAAYYINDYRFANYYLTISYMYTHI